MLLRASEIPLEKERNSFPPSTPRRKKVRGVVILLLSLCYITFSLTYSASLCLHHHPHPDPDVTRIMITITNKRPHLDRTPTLIKVCCSMIAMADPLVKSSTILPPGTMSGTSGFRSSLLRVCQAIPEGRTQKSRRTP